MKDIYLGLFEDYLAFLSAGAHSGSEPYLKITPSSLMSTFLDGDCVHVGLKIRFGLKISQKHRQPMMMNLDPTMYHAVECWMYHY